MKTVCGACDRSSDQVRRHDGGRPVRRPKCGDLRPTVLRERFNRLSRFVRRRTLQDACVGETTYENFLDFRHFDRLNGFLYRNEWNREYDCGCRPCMRRRRHKRAATAFLIRRRLRSIRRKAGAYLVTSPHSLRLRRASFVMSLTFPPVNPRNQRLCVTRGCITDEPEVCALGVLLVVCSAWARSNVGQSSGPETRMYDGLGLESRSRTHTFVIFVVELLKKCATRSRCRPGAASLGPAASACAPNEL